MVVCGRKPFVLGGGKRGHTRNKLELFSSEQLVTDGSDDEWSEIAYWRGERTGGGDGGAGVRILLFARLAHFHTTIDGGSMG